MSIPQSELIIFDCDGVLVDSEPIVNRVLAEVLSEAGFNITYEEIARQFVGKSFQTFVEVIEASYGKPIPPASLKLRKEREIAALRQEIQATPGIIGALEQIALPKCVASNSSHQHLQLVLQLTDLLPYFEGRIYSCHDVDRPKPFPDVYLHAARQMGKAPQNCIRPPAKVLTG